MWDQAWNVVNGLSVIAILHIALTYTDLSRSLTTFTSQEVYSRAHEIEREKLGRLYRYKDHLTKSMYGLK